MIEKRRVNINPSCTTLLPWHDWRRKRLKHIMCDSASTSIVRAQELASSLYELKGAIMKRGIGIILAIMALDALCLTSFAGLCLAVADADDVPGAIRLPTDGAKAAGAGVLRRTGEGKQKVGEGKKRPWDCCDKPHCWSSDGLSSSLLCICYDWVTSCSSACETCLEVETTPSRMYRCYDWFVGNPGPGPKCRIYDQTVNN